MTDAGPQFFFIIGAMKAGTTSLYHYLAGHREIYASPRKEPRIFSHLSHSRDRSRAFAGLFEGWRGQKWAFEASTAYSKYPAVKGVPKRILEQAPDARFIYLVREPVNRMWSQYVHNVAHGREQRDFEAAIAAEPQYVDNSRYAMQIDQYLNIFSPDRLLVIVFEEMVAEWTKTQVQISEFLSIDAGDAWQTGVQLHNASSQKRVATVPQRLLRRLPGYKRIPWRLRHWVNVGSQNPLPRKDDILTIPLRTEIEDLLANDRHRLFDFLGREIPGWGNGDSSNRLADSGNRSA